MIWDFVYEIQELCDIAFHIHLLKLVDMYFSSVELSLRLVGLFQTTYDSSLGWGKCCIILFSDKLHYKSGISLLPLTSNGKK